jgi:uncharacterized glyoxalase superfamily protein PhnB
MLEMVGNPETITALAGAFGNITVIEVPIVTVADANVVFARAVAARASQVHPLGEEFGWRLRRVVGPFGHHWEIGGTLV